MGRVTIQWRGPAWLRRPAAAVGLENIYARATKLSLRGARFDDRLVASLAELRELESITLSNTDLSETAIRRLRQALPDCEIERL